MPGAETFRIAISLTAGFLTGAVVLSGDPGYAMAETIAKPR